MSYFKYYIESITQNQYRDVSDVIVKFKKEVNVFVAETNKNKVEKKELKTLIRTAKKVISYKITNVKKTDLYKFKDLLRDMISDLNSIKKKYNDYLHEYVFDDNKEYFAHVRQIELKCEKIISKIDDLKDQDLEDDDNKVTNRSKFEDKKIENKMREANYSLTSEDIKEFEKIKESISPSEWRSYKSTLIYDFQPARMEEFVRYYNKKGKLSKEQTLKRMLLYKDWLNAN